MERINEERLFLVRNDADVDLNHHPHYSGKELNFDSNDLPLTDLDGLRSHLEFGRFRAE